MKRVIFTESQIKRLLGEDVFAYSRTGAPSEEGGHGLDKVFTSQQTGEPDSGEEKRGMGATTDKKNSETCPTGYFGQVSRHYMTEENKDLKNRTFIGKQGGEAKTPGAIAYMKHKRDVDGKVLSDEEEMLVRQADGARQQSLMHKKIRQSMGDTNAFQKAGGTRQSGNGKSHTPKTNSVSITYEN